MSRRVLAVAHRGASREAPENTLAAFRAALGAGADAVELDVQLTADGRLAVIHDDSLKRTTGTRGRVRETTVAGLKALDAGSWFDGRFASERIPLLEEVVELASGRMGLFVEAKDPGRDGDIVARRIHDALGGLRGEAVVMSFDVSFVARYKRIYPSQRTALLVESPERIEAAFEAGADGVAVGLRSPVSRLALARAGQSGLGFYAWTVKSFRAFEHALHWDVDAVITDLPRQVRAAIDSVEEAAGREPGGAPEEKEAYLLWRRGVIKRMKRWPVTA